MDYDVSIVITYHVENAKDKWEAMKEAEERFLCDTHPEYDIDINPSS